MRYAILEVSDGEERVTFSTSAARPMGGGARCRAEEGMPLAGSLACAETQFCLLPVSR